MDNDEIRVAKISKELHASIDTLINLLVSQSPNVDVTMLVKDIHQFQPCPQLLDHHLNSYITRIQDCYINGLKDRVKAAEVFYTFGKVVGVKRLFNYMKPHIELIPKVLESFDMELHWFEEYLLLCWLIVLSLTPFKLDIFGKDINDKIYNIAFSRLSILGPLQDLSSRLLSSFIMRSDTERELNKFLSELSAEYFEPAEEPKKVGLLMTLNLCLKKDTKMKLTGHVENLYRFLQTIYSQESKIGSIAKIYSKLAKYLDKADMFDEVEEVINMFTDNFSNKSTEIRMILSRKYTKMITNVDDCLGIDMMIDILHSTASLVEKEPMETLDADLLHTQLLIVAQLLYLDLVDVGGIKQIREILKKTLFFQQAQITYISGSNIRDASNFLVWALSRSSIKLEADLSFEVFTDMLFSSCFDKEIMIRRSSTAALQELIGRHGTRTWNIVFPNDPANPTRSISIIEALDFIDLGSLEKSYFSIPSKILKSFPTLRDNFLEFLFQNVYNLDHELVKLSAKALRILLESEEQESINHILSKLILESATKPFESFIGISEVLPLSKNPSILQEILPIYHEIKINHHKDPPFVLESYLDLFKSLVRLGNEPTELMLENLFDAIRIDSLENSALLREIALNVNLSADYWNRWLYYMKNNNLNTAGAVTFLPIFKSKTTDVLKLLDEVRVEAETKAEILRSCASYLQRESLDNLSISTIIDKLDDYTVSEQGDVGSKIRLATLELIKENFTVFQAEELRSLVEPKLLRLAAEPIDRIRIESIKLISKFKNETQMSFETREFDEYYNALLAVYSKHYIQQKETSLEFWKGYAFTAGAMKATDSIIVSSLRSFVKFYETLNNAGKTEILLQIAANLKVEPEKLRGRTSKANRLSKQILVGLQFYSRILQLNIQTPADFNIRGLFVRVYNLHLNTNNITRLSNTIKIFGYLAIVHRFGDAEKRLHWLVVNHPIPKVRTLASEELYSVYKEKSMNGDGKYGDALCVLEEVDWTQDSKVLKKYEKNIIIVE